MYSTCMCIKEFHYVSIKQISMREGTFPAEFFVHRGKLSHKISHIAYVKRMWFNSAKSTPPFVKEKFKHLMPLWHTENSII